MTNFHSFPSSFVYSKILLVPATVRVSHGDVSFLNFDHLNIDPFRDSILVSFWKCSWDEARGPILISKYVVLRDLHFSWILHSVGW